MSEELKSLAPNADAIPASLDSLMQSKIDKLKELIGDTFTHQYNSMQVSAHENAVSLFERYAKSGDNARLKDWAARTLPALKQHLDMAKALHNKK
jgi:putative membrane protein